MDPLLNRDRHECQRCWSQTFRDTCPTCGSMHLAALVVADAGIDTPLQQAGSRWERGTLLDLSHVA